MPTARQGLAAAGDNGVFYAIAGGNGWTNVLYATVEAYDPTTDRWSTKAWLPDAASYPGAGVINGIIQRPSAPEFPVWGLVRVSATMPAAPPELGPTPASKGRIR